MLSPRTTVNHDHPETQEWRMGNLEASRVVVPVVEHPPIREVAKSSALFALPFAISCVVVVFGLAAIGFDAMPWLGVVLAVTLWAPAVAELVLRTPIPRALQLHYIIFMIAGPFAGSALHVYGAIEDWDTWVHFDSGVMLAWLGMLAVRRAEEKVGAALPVWFGLTVVQLTPMAFAAAWEICEYTSDLLLGTTAQNGNSDTMSDLAAGTLGGMLAIVLLALWRRPRSLAPYSLLHEAEHSR